MKSLGIVETSGLIGFVAATDARVAAQVGELIGSHVLANPAEGAGEAFLSETAGGEQA